jgi:hypothetical protein
MQAPDPNGDVAAVASEITSDLQFVGLYGTTNGRTCERHNCCGEHVSCGDLVRLKRTVVRVARDGEARDEDAISVVKIEDGVESCTIGFIARTKMTLPIVVGSVNKLCIISDIYDTSDNKYLRGVSKRNVGMAGLNLVDNIPISE